QAEAEHEGPQRLPEHEEALAQAVAHVGGVERGEQRHERTSRAIAADASATFSSAVLPPSAMASATQCERWSSSSCTATACSAFVTAATWSSTSMQYLSSSTIRCKPRTCPSMRRNRLWMASLFPV